MRRCNGTRKRCGGCRAGATLPSSCALGASGASARSYACSSAATDFEARCGARRGPGSWLTRAGQAALRSSSAGSARSALDEEIKARLRAFDKVVWVRLGGGLASERRASELRPQAVFHAGEAFQGEEEELVVGGTQDEVAPNAKCPISGKSILDLKSPVKCASVWGGASEGSYRGVLQGHQRLYLRAVFGAGVHREGQWDSEKPERGRQWHSHSRHADLRG